MSKELSWLGHAARRARLAPWALGRLLSQVCELENTSDHDLAIEIGCDIQTLPWLYLCRVPSERRFAEDIEQVSQRFGIDASRLAALVRRAQALAALTTYENHEIVEDQFLLAARDREDEEDPR